MKFPRGPRAQAGEVSHPAPYSGASPPASAAATALQEAPDAPAPPEGMLRQPRFTPKPGAPVMPAPVSPVRTRPVRALPASAAPAPARPAPGAPTSAGPVFSARTGPAARLAPPRPAKPVPHTEMKPVPAGPAQQTDEREHKTARALIGDQLRIPILWCEFGPCVNHCTDPGALGERDLRNRALETGWRYDGLGRLACPSCVQHDPAFWPTCPPTVIVTPA